MHVIKNIHDKKFKITYIKLNKVEFNKFILMHLTSDCIVLQLCENNNFHYKSNFDEIKII